MSRKSSFPLLVDHPEVCYLDSAATAQKPSCVLDAVDTYLRHELATIHRGTYWLALRSEDRYRKSKELLATSMGVLPHEILYTAHSTAASNLLAGSVAGTFSWPAWSTILMSIAEHHASIVPWQQLAQRYGWIIDWVDLDETFDVSMQSLQDKCHPWVKAVLCTAVSNVTWKHHSIATIGSLVKRLVPDALFVVDASQYLPHAIPHIPDRSCDAMFFTGHKLWALTGIGVLWLREWLAQTLHPHYRWGWAVHTVWMHETTFQWIPDKFEPWTPHMVWVVSLVAAWSFLQEIQANGALYDHEQRLMRLFLDETQQLRAAWLMHLVGWTDDLESDLASHIGLFSWGVPAAYNPFMVWQVLADQWVALRVWAHCAHPFHEYAWWGPTCRVSFWASTDEDDVRYLCACLRRYFGV
jgi:cysteine desulfurase/selenocysteine lyase